MEKSGNAMEGFLYRLLPPRRMLAVSRHRMGARLIPGGRASRVNYARFSGRAAHIGGFAVTGKGGAARHASATLLNGSIPGQGRAGR